MIPRNPGTPRLVLLYSLLALLSFPTLETILAGPRGLGYNLDVFDLAGGVPRIGATINEWSRYGLSWWDPYFGAGNDILAQHSIAPFAPDVGLGFLLGPFLAYAITAWLMAAVAGIGMHLFLRDVLRLPFVACFIGSLVFLFGFWHYIYGFGALGVPLGLWLADRAVRPAPRRWLAVVGWIGFDAFLLYASLSQVVLISGLLQLGWLLFATPDGPRPIVRLGWWVAAWAGSIALNGPVLLAQLTYLPISERAAWNLADIYDAQPLHAIANTLSLYSGVPFGLQVATGIGGSADRYGTFFPGVVGLVLLLIGLFVAARRPVDRRTVAVVALLGLIPLIDLVSVLATPIQQDFGFLRSSRLCASATSCRSRSLRPWRSERQRSVARPDEIGCGRSSRDVASGRSALVVRSASSSDCRSSWRRSGSRGQSGARAASRRPTSVGCWRSCRSSSGSSWSRLRSWHSAAAAGWARSSSRSCSSCLHPIAFCSPTASASRAAPSGPTSRRLR